MNGQLVYACPLGRVGFSACIERYLFVISALGTLLSSSVLNNANNNTKKNNIHRAKSMIELKLSKTPVGLVKHLMKNKEL